MTNNPTIDGVSRERQQFEEENGHRAWFVAGGRSDKTGAEGFVYEDFTTDMCWTCYFQASATLQSTITQLEDKLNKAIDLDFQRRETIEQLQARVAELESGRGEPSYWIVESPANLEPVLGAAYTAECAEKFRETDWKVVPVFTAPPAPVAVAAAKAFAKGFNTLEALDGKYKIVMQFAGHDDAWAAYTELSQMTTCLCTTAALNGDTK